MTNKILVIGSTGKVGTAVVEHLRHKSPFVKTGGGPADGGPDPAHRLLIDEILEQRGVGHVGTVDVFAGHT